MYDFDSNSGEGGGDSWARQTGPRPVPVTPLKRIDFKRSFPPLKKIKQKMFINTLNHIHFIGGQVFALMVYPLTKEEFLFRVDLEPCVETVVICKVSENGDQNLENFEFKCLIVDDGKSVIMMMADPVNISEKALTLKLHHEGSLFSERQTKRFQCYLVDATIVQKAFEIRGTLQDFTPMGLRIKIDDVYGTCIKTIDLKENLIIKLFKQQDLVFSGECKCIRYEDCGKTVIVSPLKTQQARFKKNKFRNARLNLVPTPKITFYHPFTNKRVTYELQDFTTSGFSVYEHSERSQLIPGLILSNVTLLFAGGYRMSCCAKVVYALKRGNSTIRYGFAISDMDVVTYNQLFDIYTNASDMHANFSREVDMDALWEFFFESGFIYPKKYVSLSSYKEEFKQTYKKLYHNSPEVFANFTYQQNGKIFGHVSIIKAYERTWMIHQLAAKPIDGKRTGLYVLNHVLNYFDGLYRMPSVGMDYMIFYFRPENRFPDYFFGGFCRELNNPKGCSIDCFAYLNCALPRKKSLPTGWALHECTEMDLACLHAGYKRISGGLMIDAFCLDKKRDQIYSIADLYSKYDLKRKFASFVLKAEGQPKAYFIIDESDMGVNLSELLNSIKVIITDDDGISWQILHTSLGHFAEIYSKDKVPILLYPYTFLDNQGIAYEKRYNLWILNTQYGYEYTKNLKTKAKVRLGKMIFKYLIEKLHGK